MSFASPRPILADAASPVALPPSGAAGAWGIPARPAAPDTLAAMLAGRPAIGWQRGLALGEGAAAAPGLRLLPVAGFAWTGPRGLPRTRTDHVLVWLTGGEAMLRLPRSEGPAPALLFLPAGTAFALQPAPGAEGVALLVGRDMAAAATAPFPAAVIAVAPDPAEAGGLRADLAALAEEARRDDPSAGPGRQARLGALASRLARIADRQRGERGGTDPLVRRFLALATRELPQGRTLEELAATLGCAAEALDEACVAQHGKPALELFAEVRVGRAVDLLAATDRPLDEIARQTGFRGAGELSRAVRAATGCPPEVLRPRRAS